MWRLNEQMTLTGTRFEPPSNCDLNIQYVFLTDKNVLDPLGELWWDCTGCQPPTRGPLLKWNGVSCATCKRQMWASST